MGGGEWEMIVLSLFDGISAGRLALERAGIKIDKYNKDGHVIKKLREQRKVKAYMDNFTIDDLPNVQMCVDI